MKRKIVKEYTDYGFGFPVILHNVPMVYVCETWTPEVNYKLLTHRVLWDLVQKEDALIGNEVRFIRLHFDMPHQEFADRLNVKESTVLKWERRKENCAGISYNVENDLRLFVAERLIFDKIRLGYQNHINFKDLKC